MKCLEVVLFSSQFGISTKINGVISSKTSNETINELLFLEWGIDLWYY